jgi:hypothetical protein
MGPFEKIPLLVHHRSRSGGIEASQTEVDLKALEGVPGGEPGSRTT